MNYLLEAHKPVTALSVKEAYVRAPINVYVCVSVCMCACVPTALPLPCNRELAACIAALCGMKLSKNSLHITKEMTALLPGIPITMYIERNLSYMPKFTLASVLCFI